MGIDVHLVDGTYELFRYFFALPGHRTEAGREVAATRGVVGSMLGLLEGGATHVGIATDHVIESFRNDLWPTYKDGSGVDPDLTSQFPLLEEVLETAGFRVFPMVELEADDALGAAAARAADDPGVERVLICTPDKDLGQCVGGKVVQLDRRKGVVLDEEAVRAKFGVPPESIPDWLALVGDSADGFPGLPGWGARSAATVLERYGHIEAIPADGSAWGVNVRSPGTLAATLRDNLELALLFRRLATLELDADVQAGTDELRWTGPADGFAELCAHIDAPNLASRAERIARERAASSGPPNGRATETAG